MLYFNLLLEQHVQIGKNTSMYSYRSRTITVVLACMTEAPWIINTHTPSSMLTCLHLFCLSSL